MPKHNKSVLQKKSSKSLINFAVKDVRAMPLITNEDVSSANNSIHTKKKKSAVSKEDIFKAHASYYSKK